MYLRINLCKITYRSLYNEKWKMLFIEHTSKIDFLSFKYKVAINHEKIWRNFASVIYYGGSKQLLKYLYRRNKSCV
jgi:hypothetical protein